MQQFRPRIEDRHKVMVRARLRAGETEREACIVDISTRGLSAAATPAPRQGEIVEIAVGKHTIVGQVQWTSERRFGVAFRERISVIAAISGKGNLVLPRHGQGTASAVALRNPAETSAETARSLEFFIFAAAAALAVLLIVDHLSLALASLDTVRSALASTGGG
ncbi:MAG: PilZ domain-containing protein [Candidatus Andeanibacterium colombiense]|uniref:PilZ domain-containing protein n=1 Tax=Candidatus Andeanibacterium colombiense TaxID=3121345 RepID=A0AAJ6BPP6_9SPHN|nr:MAG: PilZ domain-containing protein [Sphingomonadaceae bacterium]